MSLATQLGRHDKRLVDTHHLHSHWSEQRPNLQRLVQDSLSPAQMACMAEKAPYERFEST